MGRAARANPTARQAATGAIKAWPKPLSLKAARDARRLVLPVGFWIRAAFGLKADVRQAVVGALTGKDAA